MIETEAQVSRADGAYAWVKIRPHSPCGHCDPETGCKSVSISRMFGNAAQEFRVRNDAGAQPGELVFVAVPEDALLKSALWAYGLPLLLLLAGALLGSLIHAGWGALLGAACGLIAGFLVLRFRRSAAERLEPSIVGVAAQATGGGAGCAARCGGRSDCATH
ncbi:SoxR reducing system RseC family protein [Chitinilyticum piscinae]|uniref:SoxR reducing system RseC family protein n=1 Tax=Chitinilyticum piscinae TaxID=2866724 RepID=A0A8J7K2B8_9NEIS|nr:SoxR reducing system RseC family protein [Chitinilyticum piscinae]MBE9609817.1 SoxR reducing system RseC family protein [Chitinilyticum piscinae]